jgi:hypothetical protein
MVAKVYIQKDCEEKKRKLQNTKRLFSNYLFDVSLSRYSQKL